VTAEITRGWADEVEKSIDGRTKITDSAIRGSTVSARSFALSCLRILHFRVQRSANVRFRSAAVRPNMYITLFHQLNGSIKICKKSTLINITQQKKKEKKKKKQELRLIFGYQPT